MKHQGKQALAWVIAVSAASTVYGGASVWMKQLASQHGTGHGSGHDSEDHGDTTAVAQHGGADDAAPSSGHHAETAEHSKEHGDGHQAAGHGDEKTDVADHAGANHHAAAKEHDQESSGQHADKAKEHGADTTTHNAAKDHGANQPTHHAAAHSTEQHGGDKANEHSNSKDDKGGHLADAGHSGKTAEKDSAHAKAGTPPHWSYNKKDSAGPSNWGQLADQFSQCEKGREQSPINLKGAISKATAPKILWHYSQVAVNVENNGHTIVASMQNEQNHILIDGEKYSLAQFHFHNPSEHKIGGIPSDMELHFVHKNDKGGLAVIGVMMNEKAGDENPFFKPLWATLPREAHAKADTHPSLNLTKLLPTHRDYFHYAGSLTTPPCSQGVRWFVLKDPVTMNGSQIELYSSIFGGPTNRPVQPLFGREIIQSSGPATVAH